VKRFGTFRRISFLVGVVLGSIMFGRWQESYHAGMWMSMVLGLVVGLVVEACKTEE